MRENLTRTLAPGVLAALIVSSVSLSPLANETFPDVGFITIKSQNQVEQVRGIIDHACTKVGEKFLVSFDSYQQERLGTAGVEYKVLLHEADPASTYIVRPLCHPEPGEVDISTLGPTLDLGEGMQLVRISKVAARSIAAESQLTAVPLDQKRIRFHYLPPMVTGAFSDITDFPTDTLANRVSQDSIYAFDTRLEAFQTRYYLSDSIDRARDWIVEKFQDWGYTDVTTPTFSWHGDWHYNVMAVKPGNAEPDKVIVVGGHYDSFNQQSDPMVFAPGADDNGSGTATVMELARILADVPLRKTIIFMAFSAEEIGLIGSAAAAEEFVNAGTDIEVMYNFDMVGFTDDALWDISVTGGLSTAYRDVTSQAATRVTSLIPIIDSSPGGSDHSSFRNQGYNVVFTIEADFNYGGWHTNQDLSSRMDFPYFAEVVKMAVA